MIDVLKYQDDHKEISRRVWETIQGKGQPDRAVHFEDVQNQLWLYWLEAARRKGHKSDRSHLLGIPIWRLGNWLERIVRTDRVWIDREEMLSTDLDLNWLVWGSNKEPWCYLNSFERYLIYSRFVECKSVTEIAGSLRVTRQKIHRNMVTIISFLRSYYDAKAT